MSPKRFINGPAFARISAALVGVMLAGSVYANTITGEQARAWEEFEARCLVPMENVETIGIDDLPLLVSMAVDGRPGWEHRSYVLPDKRSALIATVSETQDWKSCAISLTNRSPAEEQDQFLNDALEWMATVVSGNRYVKVADDDPGSPIKETFTLRSHEIREPVLDIRLWQQSEHKNWIISAEETDLES